MPRQGKSKKHRQKSGYTLVIAPLDMDRPAKSMRFTPADSRRLGFIIFLIFAAIAGAAAFVVMVYLNMRQVNAEQAEQIAILTQEKADLQTKNNELDSKIEQLSRSLNQKVARENNAEKEETEHHLPTAFPLSGATSYTEAWDFPDTTTVEQDLKKYKQRTDAGESTEAFEGAPLLYFSDIANGASIIATADGTVKSIDEDPKYGTVVIIDHGNGYESIYRNKGTPVVRLGDDIKRGNILIPIASNNIVGYQIKENGNFINPTDMVTIDG